MKKLWGYISIVFSAILLAFVYYIFIIKNILLLPGLTASPQ